MLNWHNLVHTSPHLLLLHLPAPQHLNTVSHTPFPTTHTRTNVFPDGATSVESDTLGLVRSRTGQVAATGMTKRYPAVFELFCRWLRENQPVIFEHPFACTSISVNHGYAARRHRCV